MMHSTYLKRVFNNRYLLRLPYLYRWEVDGIPTCLEIPDRIGDCNSVADVIADLPILQMHLFMEPGKRLRIIKPETPFFVVRYEDVQDVPLLQLRWYIDAIQLNSDQLVWIGSVPLNKILHPNYDCMKQCICRYCLTKCMDEQIKCESRLRCDDICLEEDLFQFRRLMGGDKAWSKIR